MKTLIVDNYDSFTYNLYDYLAIVNEQEPLVIHNDKLDLDAFDFGEIGNIVISPGPGHPANSNSIGCCAELTSRIARGEIDKPLLGVCLGMQIIGVSLGMTIAQTPELFHGRTSPVYHDGTRLFQGISNPLRAMRYHSLFLQGKIPTSLRITATTPTSDSGQFIPMAIEHTSRPIWGVQFHPESVGSACGHLLLANFRDLSLRYISNNSSKMAPIMANSYSKKTRFHLQALNASRDTPGNATSLMHGESSPNSLHYKQVPLDIPADALFRALYAHEANSFWLDSNMPEHPLSNCSFMGCCQTEHDFVCTYNSPEQQLTVTHPAAKVVADTDAQNAASIARQLKDTSIFTFLEDHLRHRGGNSATVDKTQSDVTGAQLPFHFRGGFVGYFGYELKSELTGTRHHSSPTPDACFLYTETFLAITPSPDNSIYIVAIGGDEKECQARIFKLAERISSAIAAEKSRVAKPFLTDTESDVVINKQPILIPDSNRVGYLQSISKALSYIQCGESYQVCLTNQSRTQLDADPLALYNILRATNPAPYSAYLRFGDIAVLSSSPERFLRITPERKIETRPIKGSAARSDDLTADGNIARMLAESEKNKAENIMIVDLLRNDLSRVSEIGSVEVTKLMEVETFSTIHQLVSTITGKLHKECSSVECIKALFPGGSMTGAPKIRTMDIIDSLEPSARGIYSGALGFISIDGSIDLSIIIRTIVMQKIEKQSSQEHLSQDGRELNRYELSVGSGGGVVALSSPAEEYEEMLLKTLSLERAIRQYVKGSNSGRGAES